LLASVVIAIVVSLKYTVPALGSLAASGIFLFPTSMLAAVGYIVGAMLGSVINIYVIATLITFYRHAEEYSRPLKLYDTKSLETAGAFS
jgi:hypothetical protein